MSLVSDLHLAPILKRLSHVALAASFAPLPLSFDSEEARQEDLLYDGLTRALNGVAAEVSARVASRQHTHIDTGLHSFLARVYYLSVTILKLYDLREDLIELAVARGSANLHRLQSVQLLSSPLAGRVQPSSLSLGDHEGRSALWSHFLAERALPTGEADGLRRAQEPGERATQQLLPPGAVRLLRAWEREVEDAVAEIDVSRTAEQIADHPLYVPLFDTSSLETQEFVDENGTRYTVRPTVEPDTVFPPLHQHAAGRDEHSLEGYNMVLPRWTGESRERDVRTGHEFWKVIKRVREKRQEGSGGQHDS